MVGALQTHVLISPAQAQRFHSVVGLVRVMKVVPCMTAMNAP
jgi:hypothetical protein